MKQRNQAQGQNLWKCKQKNKQQQQHEIIIKSSVNNNYDALRFFNETVVKSNSNLFTEIIIL